MESTWKGYQSAHDAYAIPQSTNPALPEYQTTDASSGKTGFQDLKPSYPELQANYDAMSGKWKGINANGNSELLPSDFKSGARPVSPR
jgi:hypothetical protein